MGYDSILRAPNAVIEFYYKLAYFADINEAIALPTAPIRCILIHAISIGTHTFGKSTVFWKRGFTTNFQKLHQ